MSYFNSGMFIAWLPDVRSLLLNEHVATNLSTAWFQIFGIMIFTSTIMTNVTPYIAVLFDILSSKCFKKKQRSA